MMPDTLKKIGLWGIPFLTFLIMVIYENKGLSSLISMILFPAIIALIIFAFIFLSIYGLSKIKPENDKSEIDGLVGGGISFLVAVFLIYLDYALTIFTTRFSVYLSLLLWPIPTVLVATSLTKTKWKGTIVGCLTYVLMILGILALLFFMHGP